MPSKTSPHKVPDPSSFELDSRGRVNRRLITQEIWQKLLDHYRLNPGDHTGAAKAAGVGYGTARKAWDEGYKRRADRPAIREIVAKETQELRGELSDLRRLTTKDRAIRAKKAENDVTDDRALEARLLRTARGNALMSMAVSQNMLKMALVLTQRLSNMLDDPAHTFTPGQIVRLVGSILRSNHAALEAAGVTTRMQKDMLGGPEVLVQVANMTSEDAIKTIEDGQRTLRRLRGKLADHEAEGADKAVKMLDTVIIEHEEEKKKPLLRPSTPPPTCRALKLPSSSNISGAQYEEETETLWISFSKKNGPDSTYRYVDVPVEVVNDWERAISAGKFFKAAIKTRYEYEKVSE